jgi:tetratricopeptide (TPR) repeat protein
METIPKIVLAISAILFAVGIYLCTRKDLDNLRLKLTTIFLSALVLCVIVVLGPADITWLSLGIGNVYFAMGKSDEAVAAARAYDKPNPTKEDKEILEKLVKESVGHAPEYYMLLATKAWRSNELDQAFQYAFMGLSMEPKKKVRATLIHRLGTIYEDIGNKGLAEEKYKQAITQDPLFTWPHNNLGVLYKRMGRYEEALKEYEEAIGLYPNYTHVHNNLGVLYQEMGRHEEAEKEYKESIRLSPNFAYPHHNLGVLYQKIGRHEEAEKEYKEAIRLNPKFANVSKGVLYERMGKYEEVFERGRKKP